MTSQNDVSLADRVNGLSGRTLHAALCKIVQEKTSTLDTLEQIINFLEEKDLCPQLEIGDNALSYLTDEAMAMINQANQLVKNPKRDTVPPDDLNPERFDETSEEFNPSSGSYSLDLVYEALSDRYFIPLSG